MFAVIRNEQEGAEEDEQEGAEEDELHDNTLAEHPCSPSKQRARTTHRSRQ